MATRITGSAPPRTRGDRDPQGNARPARPAPRVPVPPGAVPPRPVPPYAVPPQAVPPQAVPPRGTSPARGARSQPARPPARTVTPAGRPGLKAVLALGTEAPPRARTAARPKAAPKAAPPRTASIATLSKTAPPKTAPKATLPKTASRAAPPKTAPPKAAPPKAAPPKTAPPKTALPKAAPPKTAPPKSAPPIGPVPRATPRAASGAASPETADVGGARRRMPFLLLIVGMLCGALVCLLVISTTLAAGSFRITSLQQRDQALAKQQQQLQQQVAQDQAPSVIAQRAEQLGMRPVTQLEFLNVKTGKISSDAATGADAQIQVPGYTP
jgi:hypothetical protein